jgi:hypothetical protein
MRALLRRFEPFSDLDPETLCRVERHVRCVSIPAARWLVRRGRTLAHHQFLLSGRIRTHGPDRVIFAGSPLARAAVYPGHEGIETLTAVRVLQIGSRELDFLLDARSIREERIEDPADDWQARFLRSHLMVDLPMLLWQRLLRALTPIDATCGDRLIVEGDASDVRRCFILASGAARVARGGRTLRTLGAGDFFGEDALLSGRPRNASVTMTRSGRVMCLDEADFRAFLLEAVLGGHETAPQGHAFSNLRPIDFPADGAERIRERLEHLDPCACYRVTGGDRALASLALFLLRSRGLKASAGFD